MPDTKPTLAARAWLQSGQAPKDRAPEVIRAAALLSGQIPPMASALTPPLSEDVELALVIEADARGHLALVDLLSTHAASKNVSKHAKKLLFRAKQRGAVVPDRPQTRTPVSLAARPEPLPSHASTFDAEGNQLLMLGGWTATDGSWCLAGFVHDSEGLYSVYFMPHLSRTAHKDIVEKMRLSFHADLTPVPDEFASGRLRWGMERRDARQATWDGDQADARRILSDAEALGEIEFNLEEEAEAQLTARLASETQTCAVAKALLESRVLKQAWVKAQQGLSAQEIPGALVPFLADWFNTERRTNLAGRLEIDAWLRHQMHDQPAMLEALALARLMRDASRSVTQSTLFVRTAQSVLLPVQAASLPDELETASAL